MFADLAIGTVVLRFYQRASGHPWYEFPTVQAHSRTAAQQHPEVRNRRPPPVSHLRRRPQKRLGRVYLVDPDCSGDLFSFSHLSLVADGTVQQPLHLDLLLASPVPVPLHRLRPPRPPVRLRHGTEQQPSQQRTISGLSRARSTKNAEKNVSALRTNDGCRRKKSVCLANKCMLCSGTLESTLFRHPTAKGRRTQNKFRI